MLRVVKNRRRCNRRTEEDSQEEDSQKERDWGEGDGVKQGAGSRDNVKNIARNDELFVRRLTE